MFFDKPTVILWTNSCCWLNTPGLCQSLPWLIIYKYRCVFSQHCMWIVWMLIMVRWPSCYVVFLDMNYPSQLPTRNMILHLGQKLWKIPWLNLSIKLKGNITILLQYCMTFSLSSVRYIYLWLSFLVLCTMKYCIEYGDYGYLLDFLFFLWELSSMKIIWYN